MATTPASGPAATSAKRWLKIALSCLLLYVVCYIILSFGGGYVWTQSGQVRYDFGLSVTDLEQWQPRYTFCQRFRLIDGSWTIRANFLGYVFAPLVLLDQTFVHKTVRLFDPETGKVIDRQRT